MVCVVTVVGVEGGDVVDHEATARLEHPQHLATCGLQVGHVRHRLDGVHRVEALVRKVERHVEVADVEVGAVQVGVAPGLGDLRAVDVDTEQLGAGQFGHVLGDGPATAAQVEHLGARQHGEVVGDDLLEQDLVVQHRLVRVDRWRHVHLLDRAERAHDVDHLVELADLVATSLVVPLHRDAQVVIGPGVLRRVGEQLGVGAHVGVVVLIGQSP